MKTKQLLFLTALLEEPSINKAIKRAGISSSTAYKYLNDEEFKKELDKRRNEAISDAVRYLQNKMTLCTEKLIDIIENQDTSDQVRINAINAVFTNYKYLNDNYEINERLNELEELARRQ